MSIQRKSIYRSVPRYRTKWSYVIMNAELCTRPHAQLIPPSRLIRSHAYANYIGEGIIFIEISVELLWSVADEQASSELQISLKWFQRSCECDNDSIPIALINSTELQSRSAVDLTTWSLSSTLRGSYSLFGPDPTRAYRSRTEHEHPADCTVSENVISTTRFRNSSQPRNAAARK